MDNSAAEDMKGLTKISNTRDNPIDLISPVEKSRQQNVEETTISVIDISTTKERPKKKKRSKRVSSTEEENDCFKKNEQKEETLHDIISMLEVDNEVIPEPKKRKGKFMVLVDESQDESDDTVKGKYVCDDNQSMNIKRKKKKIKRRERMDEQGWKSIYTRSSPKQFYKCVMLLKNNQKEAIKKMGFGKMLHFNVDVIPSKLAHFVVDRFDDKKMEIVCDNGILKVDCETIHKLLGIPMGGKKIESIVPMEKFSDGIKKWRMQYKGRIISPSKLVQNIIIAKDEDNFDFRMNFLMLFLTILVECTKNGSVRETILRYVTEETDFSKIDWCDYVMESLKSCKTGWNREESKSLFSGPLTILTLLYVQSFECKGISVDENVDTIEFWNNARLKIRENAEIKNGGFGKGRLKDGNTTDVKNSEPIQSDKGVELKIELEHMQEMFNSWVQVNDNLEKGLNELLRKWEGNNEVLSLLGQYESFCYSKMQMKNKVYQAHVKTNEKSVKNNDTDNIVGGDWEIELSQHRLLKTQGVKDTQLLTLDINGPNWNLELSQDANTFYGFLEGGEYSGANQICEQSSMTTPVQGHCEADVKDTKVLSDDMDVPNWSLGLSPAEKTVSAVLESLKDDLEKKHEVHCWLGSLCDDGMLESGLGCEEMDNSTEKNNDTQNETDDKVWPIVLYNQNVDKDDKENASRGVDFAKI